MRRDRQRSGFQAQRRGWGPSSGVCQDAGGILDPGIGFVPLDGEGRGWFVGFANLIFSDERTKVRTERVRTRQVSQSASPRPIPLAFPSTTPEALHQRPPSYQSHVMGLAARCNPLLSPTLGNCPGLAQEREKKATAIDTRGSLQAVSGRC